MTFLRPPARPPIRRRLPGLGSGATAVVALTLLLAGCGHSDGTTGPSHRADPAPEAGQLSNSVDSYPAEQTPEAAVLAPVNDLGVAGKVIEVGEPIVPHLPAEALRDRALSPDDPVNNLASIPVTIEITETFFGAATVGDRLVLRMLGGQTDQVQTDAEPAESITRLQPGTAIAAFGPAPTTYADAPTMLTPSQLFVTAGDELEPVLHRSTGTGEAATLEHLRALAAQRAADQTKAE